MQKELTLIHLGVAGNSSNCHSNSKRTLTLCGKLYLMFKTEMLFPQRPWNMERMLFGFQGPGGNEPLSSQLKCLQCLDIHIY